MTFYHNKALNKQLPRILIVLTALYRAADAAACYLLQVGCSVLIGARFHCCFCLFACIYTAIYVHLATVEDYCTKCTAQKVR